MLDLNNNTELSVKSELQLSKNYPLTKEYGRLDQRIKDYMAMALSPSTIKFYKIDLRIFAEFCTSMGAQAFPATPETVARFLAQQTDMGIKPATLTRRLAAIRMAHESKGYNNPTQHKGIKTVFKGIKREQGASQNKKAPATAERITAMIAHCPNTLIGLRDKALLLIGFAGAFRRSDNGSI